jgi:hypothetical protein
LKEGPRRKMKRGVVFIGHHHMGWSHHASHFTPSQLLLIVTPMMGCPYVHFQKTELVD